MKNGAENLKTIAKAGLMLKAGKAAKKSSVKLTKDLTKKILGKLAERSITAGLILTTTGILGKTAGATAKAGRSASKSLMKRVRRSRPARYFRKKRFRKNLRKALMLSGHSRGSSRAAKRLRNTSAAQTEKNRGPKKSLSLRLKSPERKLRLQKEKATVSSTNP